MPGCRSESLRVGCTTFNPVLEVPVPSQVHGLATLIASRQIRSEGAERIEHKSLAASVISLLRDGLSVKAVGGRRRAPPITGTTRRGESFTR